MKSINVSELYIGKGVYPEARAWLADEVGLEIPMMAGRRVHLDRPEPSGFCCQG
jgi:hypothetical protein